MSMKPRPIRSLKRKKPHLAPREKVLIVCEGNETEPNYFQCLIREWRLTSVKIIGKECGSAPISVVDCAIQKNDASRKAKDEIPYRATWCVMDVEIPQHLTLDEALDKARSHGFRIILTNPCFEYWYILHFEKTARGMNNNAEVLEYLKGHFPDYGKGDTKILPVLFPLTDAAIVNSKQVIHEKNYENDFGNDLRKCNPSTHVHILVEFLKSIAQ